MINNILELVVSDDQTLNYKIVDFSGNLDTDNIRENRNKLFDIVENTNRKYLIFNFLNLEFINSESISLLLQFNEILQKKNQKLILINAKKNVVDVLNVIGVFEIIAYFHDLGEFTKSIL